MYNVDDVSLDKFYENCLFIVFLSLCEGWGLLIVEVLFYGKVCFVLVMIFMLEVGGDCVDYFELIDEDVFIVLVI